MSYSRVCPCCGEEFQTCHGIKKYCSSKCQLVASRNSTWLLKKINPKDRCKQLLAGAKNRANTKNLPYNLDLNYLYDVWVEQDGKCCVSGIAFNLDFPRREGKANFDAPSLDRIIPELGYVKGNVRLVIYQVNVGISSYGLENFLDLCKVISTYQGTGN